MIGDSVVDTNVLIVANDPAHRAGCECHGECVEALLAIRDRKSLLLDSEWRILGEYARKVGTVREPRVGSEFFRWAASGSIAANVRITADGDGGFAEFPDDPRLAGFDRQDRKFVAVAVASGVEPEILNAADHDWREFESPLRENGVRVRERCPEYLARKRTDRGRRARIGGSPRDR